MGSSVSIFEFILVTSLLIYFRLCFKYAVLFTSRSSSSSLGMIAEVLLSVNTQIISVFCKALIVLLITCEDHLLLLNLLLVILRIMICNAILNNVEILI